VFTAASAVSAMAPGIGMLIASVTPPQRRGMALGLWGATVDLGAALGPVIGEVRRAARARSGCLQDR
jgi:MFS family permease